MRRESHLYGLPQASQLIDDIIEVIGEDYLLDRILDNMSEENVQQLAEDLSDGRLYDLENAGDRENFLEDIGHTLDLYTKSNRIEADKLRLTLIWQIARGGEDES